MRPSSNERNLARTVLLVNTAEWTIFPSGIARSSVALLSAASLRNPHMMLRGRRSHLARQPCLARRDPPVAFPIRYTTFLSGASQPASDSHERQVKWEGIGTSRSIGGRTLSSRAESIGRLIVTRRRRMANRAQECVPGGCFCGHFPRHDDRLSKPMARGIASHAQWLGQWRV